MPTEYHFTDGGAAAADLATRIATVLSEAIATRGTASLALSGGRSPKPVLEALARTPLDWSKVVVTLVDERWVAPDAPDSNERLLRDTLLTGPAAAAHFVPMKNDAADAYAGRPAVEAAFAAIPWPLDIVLLGMGEDGHTASLIEHRPHHRGHAPRSAAPAPLADGQRHIGRAPHLSANQRRRQEGGLCPSAGGWPGRNTAYPPCPASGADAGGSLD